MIFLFCGSRLTPSLLNLRGQGRFSIPFPAIIISLSNLSHTSPTTDPPRPLGLTLLYTEQILFIKNVLVQ